jgi:hypothetical protein
MLHGLLAATDELPTRARAYLAAKSAEIPMRQWMYDAVLAQGELSARRVIVEHRVRRLVNRAGSAMPTS